MIECAKDSGHYHIKIRRPQLHGALDTFAVAALVISVEN
jgi:hypothetical protein